jgi:transcriptional regulator with XRE-family HTH domain
LAAKVCVGFTYLSQAENERQQYGGNPSDALIYKLAKVLEAEADDLLFLVKRIPDQMRRRILDRADASRKLTALDDEGLDRALAAVEKPATLVPTRRKAKDGPAGALETCDRPERALFSGKFQQKLSEKVALRELTLKPRM